MKTEELLTLIDTVSRSALSEFEMEAEGVRITLKKSGSSAPVVYADPEAVPAVKEEEKPEKFTTEMIVKSPLVGVFYEAPSPDAEPFVRVGDQVEKGQVLGIIEAMKLMNELESEYDGIVEAVLIENEQVVEYGQPLFRIR